VKNEQRHFCVSQACSFNLPFPSQPIGQLGNRGVLYLEEVVGLRSSLGTVPLPMLTERCLKLIVISKVTCRSRSQGQMSRCLITTLHTLSYIERARQHVADLDIECRSLHSISQIVNRRYLTACHALQGIKFECSVNMDKRKLFCTACPLPGQAKYPQRGCDRKCAKPATRPQEGKR